MRIEKKSRSKERQILTAMIVDKSVLSKISSKWTPQGLFKTKWANLIASWCIKYYTKYEEAPLKQIENLYEAWATNVSDKEEVKLVERFLGALSNEYEELKQDSNSNYIIDQAGVYFNQVKIEKLLETIQGNLDIEKIEEANQQIEGFHQIELGGGEGINVFQDRDAIKKAFEDKKEPLIVYPGALGEFFNDALERDSFVAFMAPEKRGKTFYLLDIAYRAMLQHRKVAFFEAGDMSQNQIMRRLMVRVSSHPLKRSIIKIPISISKNKEDKYAEVAFKKERYNKKLNYKTARRACKQLMRSKLKSKDPLFKLSCHPNSSLSVKNIKSILQSWERESWIPDVIVIDYSDILNMDHPALEGRDRINETWKQMRGISQQYHCLVITATQSDAASYNAETIDRSNFSEDKRKLAHVTGMIGINTTDEEKENGIMRLNWIALRESEYNEKTCVHVATCLELSNPSICSCF